MATNDPSCTTIRQLIEEIEALLEESPPLELTVGDPLSGPSTMPRARGAVSAFVRRESTVNTDQVRNQTFSEVEDLIVIELQYQINPKGQRMSRGELYDLADRVRNRVTRLAASGDRPKRQWNLKHFDTREQLTVEHFKLFTRFTTKRFETLGNE